MNRYPLACELAFDSEYTFRKGVTQLAKQKVGWDGAQQKVFPQAS